ncbi:MAG: alpha/beta fold hydrolase [Bacteroidota bacterium]|jgi:pimeloyl-ACP methyl ester carboxylesterase|nr:alpha/beta hydrolase [Bacteroidota bacterium]
MKFDIKQDKDYKYIDEGHGETLLLLHGLFGALSNYQFILNDFKDKYRVVIPILPIYELGLLESTVGGLVKYVRRFVDHMQLNHMIIVGNSLGGHIAQLYCLDQPQKVKAMVLTGSSGLFERSFGGTFPKRGDYEYIKQRTEYTFYDPKTATKELVDEVFDIVNDKGKAIRVISTAKSAMRENLAERLYQVTCPVLLIWGKEDNITPSFVAEEFHKLIKNSELVWMEQCGHAPMMEKPEEFNRLMANFLNKICVSV